MMKRILYLIAGLICVMAAKAQPDCIFTHYSSEDGISQNTVMGILQDYKGNMWFATWNGLNKFDGYSFKVYKAKLGSQIALTNDRMDQMGEDKFGFVFHARLLEHGDKLFVFLVIKTEVIAVRARVCQHLAPCGTTDSCFIFHNMNNVGSST